MLAIPFKVALFALTTKGRHRTSLDLVHSQRSTN
jgi:hypothetical protein